jgi:uncharacterized SAM-binding protein YcdF (DUF218 family)
MSVNPLSAALLAAFVFLLLALLGRRRGFLIAAMVVTLLLWLAATPWISYGLKSRLESRSSGVAAEALPKADAIVVLGGTLTPPASPGSDANLSAAADRLVFAARLYQLGKAPTILISGGRGMDAATMDAESVHAAALLGRWGIPASAILTETESVNTYENAVYTKLMLDQYNLRTVLLVTSALHMPRALATFESAGIETTAAATDFETSVPVVSGLEAWVADPAALEGTTRALKEYVGRLVYRQRGWIAGGQ